MAKHYRQHPHRMIEYTDVERYFSYTKKYVTGAFYSAMKKLHPHNDIDEITSEIFGFFAYCQKKRSDLFFLVDFENYKVTWTDNDSRRYRAMILDMTPPKEAGELEKRAKLLGAEQITPLEAGRLPKAETLIPSIARRHKYTNKEIKFLQNKIKRKYDNKKIVKQYNNFVLRNNLYLRTETGLKHKIYRLKHPK